jgi:phosphatidylserine decarboxylase
MTHHLTSTLSQVFGRFASKVHTPFLQKIINQSYVKLMGLDMGDFNPPASYPTLNALFTRKLMKPRVFSPDSQAIISPCDALITEVGEIHQGQALQIKGMSYRVNEVLGDKILDTVKHKFTAGKFINFYLSPRDYHRYHLPLDMQVLRAVHIPGKLYPVNIPTLKRKVDLFIENERVVIECLADNNKRFFMILVGALNVGKMEVSFEPSIQTNSAIRTPQLYTYCDLKLKKGDDFGCFQMGSTIVMLFEEDMLSTSLEVGDNVRFGQTIGTLV